MGTGFFWNHWTVEGKRNMNKILQLADRCGSPQKQFEKSTPVWVTFANTAVQLESTSAGSCCVVGNMSAQTNCTNQSPTLGHHCFFTMRQSLTWLIAAIVLTVILFYASLQAWKSDIYAVPKFAPRFERHHYNSTASRNEPRTTSWKRPG